MAALLLILAACAKKEGFVIFSTARAQGRIQAPDDCFKKGSCGGFPALKNIYDSETLPKIIVDLGNWAEDSPKGHLSSGSDVIAMMNAFPYTAAVPGITDINLPEKDFDRIIKNSQFPLIGTNLYTRNGERKSGIENHSITTVNGHKIGIFSVLLANPKRPESQKNYARFRVEKGSYDANLAINALKRDGAEIIIMLLSVNSSDQLDKGYYRDFINQVKRANIIITDDPDVKKTFRSGNTWIIPAGTENKRVSRAEITFNAENGKISAVKAKTIDIDPIKYKENADLHLLAIKFQIEEKKHFAKKIGTLKIPLPLESENVPVLANYASDCIRAWARTVVSIMPSNEPAGSFLDVNVSLSDLYRAFPKDSSIVFVKIRGENLIEALKSLNPDHFTMSGIKVFYDKDGKFEKAELNNGQLKPDKIYQIAVPDSMINEESRLLLANAAEFANSKHPTRDVMRWCISGKHVFQPYMARIIKGGR